jgi:hypothetical protein
MKDTVGCATIPRRDGWTRISVLNATDQPSDAAAVLGESSADLGAAVAGGVRAGGYWPGEMLAKGKREEWWSVRELLRNAPKLPVGSGPEGAATTFHGYWYGFRRAPDAGCENNRN